MPEIYPTFVWTRAKWREERDKKNVKTGAVSKVNMGELLEKFHKANQAGVVKGLEAAKKLKDGVTKYKAGIKTKSKELHDRIEKILEGNVDSYIKDVQGIVDAIPKYNKFRQAASEQVSEAYRQLLEHEKNGGGEGFKPTNQKAAGKALSDLLTCTQRMVYVHDGFEAANCKALDKLVYFIDGAGHWPKTASQKLVDALNKLPPKI